MEWPPLPSRLDTQSMLRILDQDAARGVLRLAAWLGLLKKWPGAAFHEILASWIKSGPMAAADFRIWWAEQAAVIADAHGVALPATVSRGAVLFDHANRKADDWWCQGWRVYAWGSGGPPPAGDGCGSCPQVLFGRGDIVTDRSRVALFNSRKPRQVQPNEPWLAALREVLAELAVLPITVASSRGTLTYDLVSFFADSRGMPLNLVTTDAAGHGGLPPELTGEAADPGDSLAGSGWRGSGRQGVLSCAIEGLACQKSARMACRDRLLASSGRPPRGAGDPQSGQSAAGIARTATASTETPVDIGTAGGVGGSARQPGAGGRIPAMDQRHLSFFGCRRKQLR